MTDCKYFVKIHYYYTLCTLLLSLTCLFQFSIRISALTEHIYCSFGHVLKSPLQLGSLADALYYVEGRHPSQLQDSKKINDQIFYL